MKLKCKMTRVHIIVPIVYLMVICSEATITHTTKILPKFSFKHTNITSEHFFERTITRDEITEINKDFHICVMVAMISFGITADSLGFRKTLLITPFPFIISFITIGLTDKVSIYYWAVIICGISVGATSTLIPIYVSEIAKYTDRGLFITCHYICRSIGYIIAYILEPYLTIRQFYLILLIFPICYIILFFYKSIESPCFLYRTDQMKIKESLMVLRGTVVEEEIEEEYINLEANADIYKHYFIDFFRNPGNFKAFMISLGLILSQEFVGINVMTTYVLSLVENSHFINPKCVPVIFGFIMLIFSLIPMFLSDSIGRKPLLIFSTIGMTICYLIIAFYYTIIYNEESNDKLYWFEILVFGSYFVNYHIGVGPLPWVIMTDLLPTFIKTTATSFIFLISDLCSILLSNFFQFGLLHFDRQGIFWIFCGLCVLDFCFMKFIVFETAQKNFIEIRKALNRRYEV